MRIKISSRHYSESWQLACTREDRGSRGFERHPLENDNLECFKKLNFYSSFFYFLVEDGRASHTIEIMPVEDYCVVAVAVVVGVDNQVCR